MQDMCGVLLYLAKQMGRKPAENILSILQNRSFDLLAFKNTVKLLRGCEDVLKRGVGSSFKRDA